MGLPAFGVRRPVANLMIFLAIIVIALYSIMRLGVDMMPEIEPPAVTVVAAYPGASAQDVEVKVTEPLENQLSTTPGIEKITSSSIEGASMITLKFAWGTNLDEASNDIRDRLELAKRYLPAIPDEMDNPFIFKFNTANFPVLFMGISCDDARYPEMYDLIDKRVGDALRQLAGVGTVQLYGGLRRQINVWIDRERLQGYGFSILDIQSALKRENVTQPLGSIKSGMTDYLLRLPGEFTSPEEINLVILGKKNGKTVYLKDVARVEDGFEELTMDVKFNGKPGLLLSVQKQNGTNTVEVSDRVKQRLSQLRTTLPPDVEMHYIFDSSQDIIDALESLKSSVWIGIVLVVLVVWFFLRQIMPSLIIALTIPFSLLISFVYLFLSGKTINVISLSSLAIASGMVVDNAIVIVDNIYRHLERGERPKEAAIYGASEMFFAIGASTMTTIVVFMPMFFISGVVGIMFGELAAIVSATLVASLFTAGTFSPMLCSRWMRKETVTRHGKRELVKMMYRFSERVFAALEGGYSTVLAWCLRHKKTVVIGFLAVFIASLLLGKMIGNEFIPDEDTGDVRITTKLALGTRLEESSLIARRIERIFAEHVPEAQFVFTRTGSIPGVARASGAGDSGEHVIVAGTKLIPKLERTRSVFEIGQVLRTEIGKIPGVLKTDIRVGNPIGRMISGAGGKAIQLEIIGNSFDETNQIAQKVKDIMERVPGAVDASISRELNRPELRIIVDREKAALLGVDMDTIASSVKTYIEGSTATKYREKGETYDIYVRLEESFRAKPEDIETLSVLSKTSGALIPLASFATVREEKGYVDIERQNRERVVRVECNVYHRSAGEVLADVMKQVGDLVLPAGVMISVGGEAEEQKKAFRDLSMLLLLGLMLVYMVMAAQFESLLDPFIVMFSVPFTFTGVLIGFVLTGTTLSLITFLGLIMLMGIVVNNAIVLISYINILRARGFSMLQAVTAGGRDRLRPVLMTTITTLVGLLPLALSRGPGSETWQPLGITMISGLSGSTLVTLLFVPTLYSVFEGRLKQNGTNKTDPGACACD